MSGFGERHGGHSQSPGDDRLELTGEDGATAVLHVPFPPLRPAGVQDLVDNACAARTVAVLLVRRGGYACAVVRGPRVVASKVGSRHVQGRTAAGGWSQQRFARRREGQAGELVRAAADVAARVLSADADRMVTGGDRALVERVLADPRLDRLTSLPCGPHLEVGDPKADVVRALPERLRSVRITLTDP